MGRRDLIYDSAVSHSHTVPAILQDLNLLAVNQASEMARPPDGEAADLLYSYCKMSCFVA